MLGTLGLATKQETQELEVLADEEAPTPTGGWVKIAKLTRPQRVSITTTEGYDPIELTVPLLFDAVMPTVDREDIEYALQKLEWMAGRGVLFKGKPGHPALGDPPLVQVWSEDGHGNSIPLIPKAFQTPSIRWKVTDLAFDKSPLRAASGHRTRQAVVVTLTQDESSPTSTSSVERAALRGTLKGKFLTQKIGAGPKTISELAAFLVKAPSERSALTAAIIKANASNRAIGTNPEKRLPVGTEVKVPIEGFA